MPFGRTPLHYAMYRDNQSAAFAEALLEAGAAVGTRDEDGYTPLHYAARGHLVDAVDLLLRRGADADSLTDESTRYGSRTPLHESMHYGPSAAVVEALLRGGADPDSGPKTGWTALHQAAWEGFAGVAESLLRGGADVNATDAKKPDASGRDHRCERAAAGDGDGDSTAAARRQMQSAVRRARRGRTARGGRRQ